MLTVHHFGIGARGRKMSQAAERLSTDPSSPWFPLRSAHANRRAPSLKDEPMSAEIRVFRCLEDNIGALVHDPATGACAAIDAPEEGPIVKALDQAGWRLTHILVTHRHRDHVQGIEPLKLRYGCRVVVPEKAASDVPVH